MNVYQETIKELKRLDASKEVVYYCSQIAFELQDKFAGGSTIEELAQYCLCTYKTYRD